MKKRWGGSHLVAVLGVIVAATAVASGAAPWAMADNSGRRICLYGSANLGDVQHFAVADYKEGEWLGATGCPPASRSRFLAAINWDERKAPYQWSKPARGTEIGYYAESKMTCEDFLSQYLKGIVPADFGEKQIDHFCDNTVDDTLYDFMVTTTVDARGRSQVEAQATNSGIKVDL